MFNTYEFTFAGESSLSYGLVVCDFDNSTQEDVAFGNVASIIESRSKSRIRPVHYGVDYHEEPLEFKLVFGSDRNFDRYDLQNIAMWLTGYQQYQWLMVDQPDMDGIAYHCLITELKPISIGWLPVAFEATVRCDSPYAYSFPIYRKITVDGTARVIFANESTVRDYLKPALQMTVTGSDFSITNQSDGGRVFAFQGLPGGETHISVDNDRGILQDMDGEFNLYDCFNMNFLRFVPGDNVLEITGSGTVEISCRFMFNTSG